MNLAQAKRLKNGDRVHIKNVREIAYYHEEVAEIGDELTFIALAPKIFIDAARLDGISHDRHQVFAVCAGNRPGIKYGINLCNLTR